MAAQPHENQLPPGINLFLILTSLCVAIKLSILTSQRRRGVEYFKFNSTGADLAQLEHRGQAYEVSVIRVLSGFWCDIAHILLTEL